jgi:hypothetical protein
MSLTRGYGFSMGDPRRFSYLTRNHLAQIYASQRRRLR